MRLPAFRREAMKHVCGFKLVFRAVNYPDRQNFS
jgi:hypothetical protein